MRAAHAVRPVRQTSGECREVERISPIGTGEREPIRASCKWQRDKPGETGAFERKHSHRRNRIMLVLSRKLGDAIVITTPDGKEIVVTVQRISMHVCSLGIEAPSEVKILRSELAEARKGAA
jgi:carbon storage regulator CsrA